MCPVSSPGISNQSTGWWGDRAATPFSRWRWSCQFAFRHWGQHLESILSPGAWQMVTQEWPILHYGDNYEGSYLTLHTQIISHSAERNHFPLVWTLNTTPQIRDAITKVYQLGRGWTLYGLFRQGKTTQEKIKRSTISTYTYNTVNLKNTMTSCGMD